MTESSPCCPHGPRGGGGVVHCKRVPRQVQTDGAAQGCESPSVTVSAGAATFPSCADNVYALFDAADEALAWAQKNTLSRAVLAHPRALSVAEVL